MIHPQVLGVAVRTVIAIRDLTAQRHTCSSWDGEGIRSALTQVEGETAGILAAAILAAADPALRKPSPAAIVNHWPQQVERPTRRNLDLCPEHPANERTSCPDCRDEHGDPLTPEQIAQAAAACKAAARKAAARQVNRENNVQPRRQESKP